MKINPSYFYKLFKNVSKVFKTQEERNLINAERKKINAETAIKWEEVQRKSLGNVEKKIKILRSLGYSDKEIRRMTENSQKKTYKQIDLNKGSSTSKKELQIGFDKKV